MDDEILKFSRRTYSRSKHISLLECNLKFIHADPLGVHNVFCGPTGKETGKFVVEVDEVLGDAAAFGLVGLED